MPLWHMPVRIVTQGNCNLAVFTCSSYRAGSRLHDLLAQSAGFSHCSCLAATFCVYISRFWLVPCWPHQRQVLPGGFGVGLFSAKQGMLTGCMRACERHACGERHSCCFRLSFAGISWCTRCSTMHGAVHWLHALLAALRSCASSAVLVLANAGRGHGHTQFCCGERQVCTWSSLLVMKWCVRYVCW